MEWRAAREGFQRGGWGGGGAAVNLRTEEYLGQNFDVSNQRHVREVFYFVCAV